MNWEETKKFQRWSEQRSRMCRVLWPASKGTFSAGRNATRRVIRAMEKLNGRGAASHIRMNMLADRRLRQRNYPGVKQP